MPARQLSDAATFAELLIFRYSFTILMPSFGCFLFRVFANHCLALPTMRPRLPAMPLFYVTVFDTPAPPVPLIVLRLSQDYRLLPLSF